MPDCLEPLVDIISFKNLLPKHGRLIAFDYGEKRVGVASSDSQRQVATPKTTLCYNSNQEIISDINVIVEEISPVGFVVGLPLHMNNNESISSSRARKFANLLQSQIPSIPILMFDERLTSVIADRIMITKADLSRKKRSKHRDKIAACLILQTVVELMRNTNT